MKTFCNRFFFVVLFVIGSVCTFGQKIGVVDTHYIMSQLPEYKDAEGRLNAQIKAWEEDIKSLQSEYEKKKAAFDSERVLLIGDQLIQREKEVVDLEKNIKTTLSLRFGTNGEIEKLRTNLLKPFQDQIWEAVRVVSEANGLGIVIDRSGDVTIIYLKKSYDYSEKVINMLTKNQKKSSAKK
ncbi:OmpH family outer membrane protein [Bergeyella zoohelcum]|uniref:OmpH family outer membrane protein n=1 Tax=Bergeyella zoohelcum TaxID=1015 RepID=UPI002A90E9D0|nr:OmpH family outer membrane protein [Bergeyella zoohelcum]MDY6025054.1 OmpH family outer membrane protein [Bergeyella zoohelcum]